MALFSSNKQDSFTDSRLLLEKLNTFHMHANSREQEMLRMHKELELEISGIVDKIDNVRNKFESSLSSESKIVQRIMQTENAVDKAISEVAALRKENDCLNKKLDEGSVKVSESVSKLNAKLGYAAVIGAAVMFIVSNLDKILKTAVEKT